MKSPSASKKQELVSRIGIGLLGIAAMVALLWLDVRTAAGLLCALSLVCLVEYDLLLRSQGIRISRLVVYPVGVAGAVFVFLSAPRTTDPLASSDLIFGLSTLVGLALPILVGLLLIVELFKKSDKPFVQVGYSLLALLYVLTPWWLLVVFAAQRELLLGFFLLLWASDTGAFFAGRALGKTPLFPRHSPKKTWEGSLGGLLLSMGVAVVCAQFWPLVPLFIWLVMAALVVVFGTLGDLCESMLKRQLGVKDSGNWLGSHGGFLDRFDGLLLAAPFFVLFLILWLTFS